MRSAGPCFSVLPRPATDSPRARFGWHSFLKALMATATADRVAQQEGRLTRAVDLGEIAVQVSLTVWVVPPSSGRPGACPRSVALVGHAQPPPGERCSSSKEPGT